MLQVSVSLLKTYLVHAHEPLRISLDDLHQADSKGKWWLVGAAWGGDPLVDRQEGREAQPSAPVELENALLKLAKKQGMNTDVRRSIFVVLMSSDVSTSYSAYGANFDLVLRIMSMHVIVYRS